MNDLRSLIEAVRVCHEAALRLADVEGEYSAAGWAFAMVQTYADLAIASGAADAAPDVPRILADAKRSITSLFGGPNNNERDRVIPRPTDRARAQARMLVAKLMAERAKQMESFRFSDLTTETAARELTVEAARLAELARAENS